MPAGTVASTDNRNWELLPDNTPQRRFSQSRAVALDMESATIAANGARLAALGEGKAVRAPREELLSLSLAALLVSEALVRRANRRVRGDDAER